MNGNSADVVIAAITGNGWMGKDTGRRIRPTRNEIGRLAYVLYEANGRQDGYDLQDWLLAEQELVHHYA